MEIATTAQDLASAVAAARADGKRIAFVPTMGALHDGHLSLVELAKEHGDFTVVSIFVNPLQFGKNEDFDRYPRDLAQDALLLVAAQVDLLFAPDTEEIYPLGSQQLTESAGAVGASFEGAIRPGHFDGMLTVVSRLFDLVQPDVAIFGAKDAQQVFLVREMLARQNGVRPRPPIELIVAPTVRESSGLAMSSRNRYLTETERVIARDISAALRAGEQAAASGGSPSEALAAAEQRLALTPEAKLEYLALVNSQSFTVIGDEFSGEALLIIAAKVGNVRLIDNQTLIF